MTTPATGGRPSSTPSPSTTSPSTATSARSPSTSSTTPPRSALRRLLAGADVLVENFSPGTVDRLGFGYEAVKALNPTIVYAAISGFGQSGPDYQRTAYDLIVQGISGMMSITGHAGGPPTRLGVPIADIGGGMFAAYAIVAALFDRERTGEGSYVDVSMLGGQVALLTYQAGLYLSMGNVPGQLGNAHPMIAPYDTFRTADGYVNIAVGNTALWERFCLALDLPSLLEEERFASNSGRSTNREALYAVLEPRLAELTTDDVVRRLDAASVPCGPIRDVAQAMDDPPDAGAGSHPRRRAPDARPSRARPALPTTSTAKGSAPAWRRRSSASRRPRSSPRRAIPRRRSPRSSPPAPRRQAIPDLVRLMRPGDGVSPDPRTACPCHWRIPNDLQATTPGSPPRTQRVASRSPAPRSHQRQ